MNATFEIAYKSLTHALTRPISILLGIIIATLSLPELTTRPVFNELYPLYTVSRFFILPLFIISLYLIISETVKTDTNMLFEEMKNKYMSVLGGDFLSIFLQTTVFAATILMNAVVVFFVAITVVPNPTGVAGINPEASLPIIVGLTAIIIFSIIGLMFYIITIFLIQFYRASIIISNQNIANAFRDSYSLSRQYTKEVAVLFTIKSLVTILTYSIIVFIWQSQTQLMFPVTLTNVLPVITLTIFVFTVRSVYNHTFTILFYESKLTKSDTENN